MSEKDQVSPRRAQIEETIRRLNEERLSALAKLGFNWESAPRTDYGQLKEHPLNPPDSLVIELVTGRRIELRKFHQYFVYQGTLCGVPPTPEGELISALESACRFFPDGGEKAVVLTPTLRSGYFRLDANGFPEPYPLVWLPKVCTITLFESDALSPSSPNVSRACSSVG